MKNIIITFLFIGLCSLAWGQPKVEISKPMLNPDFVLKGAPAGNDMNVLKGAEERKSNEKAPKAILENFNGFKVELIVTDVPLTYTDKIFDIFNNVNIEFFNDQFCYSVGQFSSASQISDYLSINVNGVFEQYRIVQYENGKRINSTGYIVAN